MYNFICFNLTKPLFHASTGTVGFLDNIIKTIRYYLQFIEINSYWNITIVNKLFN